MCIYSKDELAKALEQLAFQKTIPFCYSCYKDAPKGRCTQCGSDDLMRHLPGVGVEYGTDWVIRELLQEHVLTPEFDELFESSISDCYGEEIKVGWMTLDTVTVMKEMDPISWDMAKQEYIDGLEQEEKLVSFDNGSHYYWADDVEQLLEENNILGAA